MMKPNKRAVRITSAVLAATFTLVAVGALAAIRPKPDSYTVYADDGYYSETTYYLTEEAYNEHAAENAAATTQTRSTRQAMSSSQTENDDEQFVIAAEKTVWVEEIYDENGNVINSTLLSKNALKEYFAEEESAENNSSPKIMPIAKKPITGVEPVDEDDRLLEDDHGALYNLTLYLELKYNQSTDIYSVTSEANWVPNFTLPWKTYHDAEATYMDYWGITWGGNKTLEAQDFSISGIYERDRGNVNFSRKESDAYAGFIWQFNEQAFWPGAVMRNGVANVTLKKVGKMSGLHTNATVKYIHTYGSLDTSVTIGVNSSGLAPSITFDTTESAWELELQVDGIKY